VKPGDVVITGIPNIDPYYAGMNYFFLDENDERYASYACDRGTRERWSNLPLLYTTNALAAQATTGRRLFVIVYEGRYETLLATARARHWRTQTVWPAGHGGGAVLIVNP
jgi:hypothetical protein